jgi:hypothetical protein
MADLTVHPSPGSDASTLDLCPSNRGKSDMSNIRYARDHETGDVVHENDPAQAFLQARMSGEDYREYCAIRDAHQEELREQERQRQGIDVDPSLERNGAVNVVKALDQLTTAARSGLPVSTVRAMVNVHKAAAAYRSIAGTKFGDSDPLVGSKQGDAVAAFDNILPFIGIGVPMRLL